MIASTCPKKTKFKRKAPLLHFPFPSHRDRIVVEIFVLSHRVGRLAKAGLTERHSTSELTSRYMAGMRVLFSQAFFTRLPLFPFTE